jgi:hypothetical protein
MDPEWLIIQPLSIQEKVNRSKLRDTFEIHLDSKGVHRVPSL